MSTRLAARELVLRRGDRRVLDGVTLAVAEGELLAVLGVSGSGKTTLLRVLAGLDRPDAGEATIDGQPAHQRLRDRPRDHGVGLLFQDLGLWPHLTAAKQVALVAREAGASDPTRRAQALLEELGLGDRRTARPDELSGGEQQRLALARCLAGAPRVLLLDEPLSNLDRPLRDQLVEQIRAHHEALGAATVYVTHDRGEALRADRLAILDAGRLVQVGPPVELVRHPRTASVARLTGECTILDGERSGDRVALAGASLPCAGAPPDGPVQIVVRPDDLVVSDDGPLAAEVVACAFGAGGWRAACRIDDHVLSVAVPARLEPGTRIRLTGRPDTRHGLHLLPPVARHA